MIRIFRADLGGWPPAEAYMRSVGSDLGALTGRDRDLGIQAGEAALAPLGALGEVPVGGAMVTPAGGLDATFLIHVVLRSREEAVSEFTVRRAFLNGLRQATEWGIETLAVSALGTGAGNLDTETSARIMMEVLDAHLKTRFLPREISIVTWSDYEKDTFAAAAEGMPGSPASGGGDGGR